MSHKSNPTCPLSLCSRVQSFTTATYRKRDRGYLWHLIELLGANHILKWENGNTYVISPTGKGRKVDASVSASVRAESETRVLNHRWLEASLARWNWLPPSSDEMFRDFTLPEELVNSTMGNIRFEKGCIEEWFRQHGGNESRKRRGAAQATSTASRSKKRGQSSRTDGHIGAGGVGEEDTIIVGSEDEELQMEGRVTPNKKPKRQRRTGDTSRSEGSTAQDAKRKR